MKDDSGNSVYRRHKGAVDAGIHGYEHDDESSSPSNIPTTKRFVRDGLFQKILLVSNASRRFRYTLDLKKEKERRQLIAKFRTHTKGIRAVFLFQAAASGQGLSVPDISNLPPSSLSTGVSDIIIDVEEMRERSCFGSNTCPWNQVKSFMRSVRVACPVTNLICLTTLAAAFVVIGLYLCHTLK